MPYLNQGEFYSEFGNYDVRITVPKDYVVASTGSIQNKEEWLWEESRFIPQAKKSTLTNSKNKTAKKPSQIERDTATKTLRFLQNNVHDFALFANKEFIVKRDSCLLPSCRGRPSSSLATRRGTSRKTSSGWLGHKGFSSVLEVALGSDVACTTFCGLVHAFDS